MQDFHNAIIGNPFFGAEGMYKLFLLVPAYCSVDGRKAFDSMSVQTLNIGHPSFPECITWITHAGNFEAVYFIVLPLL